MLSNHSSHQILNHESKSTLNIKQLSQKETENTRKFSFDAQNLNEEKHIKSNQNLNRSIDLCDKVKNVRTLNPEMTKHTSDEMKMLNKSSL